jgi:RNA polymerase sigma-70 factor, ECF subfamily
VDDKITRTVNQVESLAHPPQDWFENVFHSHWSSILRFLVRLTGDGEEAEDLALEVFWRLHQQPPQDWQNLKGWLFKVAANLGYTALRAARRRKHYEALAAESSLASAGEGDLLKLVEKNEARQRVRQVLGKMKPQFAKLLVLRHSGLSYQEVAQALEISPGSVGTLLARAEKDFTRRYERLEKD